MAAKKKTPRKHAKKPESKGKGELTYRQRMFVSHYLGEANGNATEAARLAGYASPNVHGTRLLANASIRAAVDAQLSQSAMSAHEVLARLSDLASADMGDFITIDGKGEVRIDLKKARTSGKLHLVKAIKHTRYGLAIELHASPAALDKLARHHGLYGKDKLEIGVTAADAVKEMDEAVARYEREHPSDAQGADPGRAEEVQD